MHLGFHEQSPDALQPSDAVSETEEYLRFQAKGRFGAIPLELVVSHLMKLCRGTDFATHEAALEALIRRMGFARRDELQLAGKPNGGKVLGAYTTRRKSERKSARPYSTLLDSIEPLRGSCDCPDYTKSSLGICKHLLVVLESVWSSPRKVARAEREVASARTRVDWDPILPMTGPLDRLAGLRLEGALPAAALARRFTKDGYIDVRALRPRRERGRAVAVISQSRIVKTPAALAILRQEAERCSRESECEASLSKALATLRTLKRRLYPYQREGVTEFLRKGRLLLADDMGLGKTTQAIAVCHALFNSGRVSRGLLVVPASLKPQWLREWHDTSKSPAWVIDGSPAERAEQYRALKRGFAIIGYEQLLRDFHLVRALDPELVILDEAQRIKNWATKSAQYVKALTPRYRLVLTGTPMENRLEELASLLDWIDDVALAPKWRLVPAYTQVTGDGAEGQAGARNLKTLRERLRPCVLRRVRKEVLAQLPRRVDTRVPVEMTQAQRCEHDELDRPIAALISQRQRRPLRQEEFMQLMQLLNKQRMISNGLGQVEFESLWPTIATTRPNAARLNSLAAPKLVELRRIVEDIAVAQERKVVIFSQWRRMLRLAHWSLGDILGDAGLSARFFTGAERTAQRTRSVVDFHDDPNVRVLFLSDAGGVGLNLQRAASACINIELPWNPAVLEQRIGRIYRLGQKRPIDVYNLVCDYGIESRISDLVGNKRALFDSVFDGTSDAVNFDGAAPFLEQMERMVDSPTLAPIESDDDDVGAQDLDEETLEPSAKPFADGGGDFAGLLAKLRVERTPSGGIRIEAPAEAAGALSSLLSAMAQLVDASRGAQAHPE
ncbi:MAG: DEAD/DEAH box helicase [Polyangiaceae bacterium]